ncbi:serine/threonine-protein kinase [Acanthocystis turfacea Chlorella virus NTS-1]|nr:serine/threonine-protein kinase [Acanthocystis turfacea Chlorella virus NTS-1]
MFLCCFCPGGNTEADKAANELNNAGGVFQDYKFNSVIGDGGCAAVWEAVEKSTGETVAIKMSASGKYAEWMAKEFSIMRKFDSPHVVRPMAFVESKTASFMVMKKYYASLFDLISNGPIVGKDLKHIVKQIAMGLKGIHDAGYVHRDIKPENILYNKDGTFAIVDFGLAEDEYSMTVRSPVGTSSYIAPEIADGVLHPEKALLTVGKPVDVYALGQVIYGCITQRNAIPQSKSTREIVRNNLRFDMTPFIDELSVGDDLKDLLRGMTDRNPETRATIDEVLAHKFLH